jgi:hypothetical protein
MSHMAAHGMPASTEFMRPDAPLPRPPEVEQRSWEALAIHVDDARRGGAIASVALRAAVDVVVAELRVGCIAWEEVYTILDAAGMAGSTRRASHPLELELHASRGAAIVAHMHSWADVLRLAELEDPCEETR